MDIEARIENWRICFKDNHHSFKTGSLEGNYREPQITKEMLELVKDEVFENKVTAKRTIDINDAIKVERAVIALPIKYKMVLVVDTMYHYLLNGSHFRKTCKIIGISIDSAVFDDYLKKAKIMIENSLQ